MYWSDRIKLIVVIKGKTPGGYPKEDTRHETSMFADSKSANRGEFYSAMQAGMKADIMFRIWADAWARARKKDERGRWVEPSIVAFGDHEYDIVRTHTNDRYEMELTCTRRV